MKLIISQIKVRKGNFAPRATIAFKSKAVYSRKAKHKGGYNNE